MRLPSNAPPKGKNRYGVWIVRHKVPQHLEGPVACVLNNGKERQTYLQKSTGTKDKTEAKRIAVDVLATFNETLSEAAALLTERPLRTSLMQSEIDRIAEFYFCWSCGVYGPQGARAQRPRLPTPRHCPDAAKSSRRSSLMR